MNSVIEGQPVDSDEEHAPAEGLFVVWFDLNFGEPPSDWWWEKPGPQPLSAALDLAAKLRADCWVCKVLPDGQSPRSDGQLLKLPRP